MRTLYGPIDSWRFGRSLGVDPLAGREKRCPFSCVYCQYGATPQPTFRRRAFVTPSRLAADLASLGSVDADCVTFAGLGEPTLASNLPELVATIRRAGGQLGATTSTLEGPPVILLTGSGLIARADVRQDVQVFDTVVAALDAADEGMFQRINRPGRGFPSTFAAIVEGLRRLRHAYAGHLVLQMMFLQANQHAAPQMAALARTIAPDEVQLHTPLQPALGGPISETEMRQVTQAFSGFQVTTVYGRGPGQLKPRMM